MFLNKEVANVFSFLFTRQVYKCKDARNLSIKIFVRFSTNSYKGTFLFLFFKIRVLRIYK